LRRSFLSFRCSFRTEIRKYRVIRKRIIKQKGIEIRKNIENRKKIESGKELQSRKLDKIVLLLAYPVKLKVENSDHRVQILAVVKGANIRVTARQLDPQVSSPLLACPLPVLAIQPLIPVKKLVTAAALRLQHATAAA